jgi:hypothetical protein
VSRVALLAGVAVLMAGCGSPSATPTAVPPTPVRSVSPIPSTPAPSPTVAVSPAYLSFVRSICAAMRSGNAGGVTSHLMHYQYNSGLRWGTLGDGEGTTSDPSTLATWLSGSHVSCKSFSPNIGGHGTLLTSGWARPAPAALLDLDLLNGQWVINDFTFGSPNVMAQTMHSVTRPTITYRR